MHPRRVQLLVRFGYEGSRFHGLQPQPHLPTAGGALRRRLTEALGQPPKALAFSARTDAGVHALVNLATCWFVGPLDAPALFRKLAEDRDDGLQDVRAEIVPPHVHARGTAHGKRYRYLLEDCAAEDSLDSRFCWQIVPSIDLVSMREAAALLVGTHDFSSFRAAKCAMGSPVKHLQQIRIGGPFELFDGRRRFVIEFVGDGFLRKMVRNLVGTLVEVGCGLRAPTDVTRILQARVRSAAGLTAPARGLTLMQVGSSWPDDGSRRIPELAPSHEATAHAIRGGQSHPAGSASH